MKPQDNFKDQTTSRQQPTLAEGRPAVIAVRKTCDASGTGLSHYVLMDKEVQR